jgi:hypothetical protein
MLRRKIDEQIREIDRAERQPNRRHHYVVGERGHDFPKRSADYEAHREINHVALDCELFELRKYRHDESSISFSISPAYQSIGAPQCKTIRNFALANSAGLTSKKAFCYAI